MLASSLAPKASITALAKLAAKYGIYNTRAIQQQDTAHHLHPFTDFKALAQSGAQVIVAGKGCYVWDSAGKKILDGMSGLWCVNAGYGRTSISEAVYLQMETLAFYGSFSNTTNVPAIQLASKLVEISPPQFKHVFFTNSGSEANDTSLRLVRRYWDLLGQTERTIIISRQNAYHGSTIACASLGGMADMQVQTGMQLPGIVHIGQPNYFECGRGMTEDEFGLHAAGWLEQKILKSGIDKVAAFIAEPIQGAGGVIIPPASYWPEIQRICDKYGILLIADEVICGFGRLGTWFGSERMGIKPDLISFANSVTSGYAPLGGVLVSERIADVLTTTDGDFYHGFTCSGHPVACAAALENIRIFQEEELLHVVSLNTGPYLAKQFSGLAKHPLVGFSYSYGLLAGLHLVRKKADVIHDCELFDVEQAVGQICHQHMLANGLMVLAVGERMIVSPPLVISKQEINEMMVKITQGLDQTLAELKARGWM
ncbi:aminotransferase [Undibacterium sp. RuTC16W]|uniref:aminotransferase n=1 Tax=Undibacterium sp. RuTC16W TaxID=3413048 RepID=UPI003BF05D7F